MALRLGPAIGVKSTESAIQAATRELREEVGIEVDSNSLMLVEEFICHGEFKKDHATGFEVVLGSEPEVRIDGFEVVEAQFVEFAELCKRRHEFTEPASRYVEWKLQSEASGGARA